MSQAEVRDSLFRASCSDVLTWGRLKCNRAHPCENCVKRCYQCVYASPVTRKKSQVQEPTTPDAMQHRIDRLEGLILSLMTNGSQSAGPMAANAAITRSMSDTPSMTTADAEAEDDDDDDMMVKEGTDEVDSDIDDVAESLGMMKFDVEKGRSMYFGGSNWHTILKDVSLMLIVTLGATGAKRAEFA